MSKPSSGQRLLEREDELAALTKLIAAARARKGPVVVVEGPPGIGKTELLGALAESATTAGFEVLSARGGELEQGFAFGVVRQLFEALVAGLPASERRALFSGATALARPLLDPNAEPQVVSGSADPFPLLHGLYWLAANLAEQTPLALVVDDAHWADHPSLRWLHYLARRLEGVPALVALAARSTIPEAPLEPIEAIKADGSCALLRPTPLSEQASGTLLAQVFGSDPGPKLVHEAHRVTQGNPFLLTELGRSLAADGVVPGDDAAVRVKRATPQTVGRSALARLARLPSASRRLAQATALLGEDGELRHAAVLAGLGESEALSAADRLTAAGFLAATPRRAASQLRFAHPLIRQALYADLPAGERAARHKNVARLLAREPGTAERVAAHLMESIPAADPWVVEVLRQAAGIAMGHGAPAIAASYLRRGLDEPPPEQDRLGVLLELGRAEAHALDPRGVAHLKAAAGTASPPSHRAAALGTLAFIRFMQSDSSGAFRTGREALGLMVPGAGGESEAQLLVSCLWAGRAVPELVEEARTLLEQPRSDPSGEPTPAELVRVSMQAHDDLLRGRRRRAVERLDWVARQPAELFEDDFTPTVLALGLAQAFCGQDREAEAALGRALVQARRHGNKLYMGTSLDGLAYLRWRRGDLAGAIGDAEMMLGLLAQTGEGEGDHPMIWARIMRALCLVEQGDLAVARSALDIPEQAQVRLRGWMRQWIPYAKARLALARGEWVEARIQALAAGDRVLAIGAVSPDYLPWRSLAAQAMARAGEREPALALAREELGLAREESSPRATGIALCALGTIEGGKEGLGPLAEAVEILKDTPDRLEHARALCELGAALRRANRRARSREPLRQAIELARACGAIPLAERAHAELRATGARPRTLVFSGAESLTARERQVAELAAAGCSNTQIAQSLFVTRKTVETHLGAVYRKLGLDSREQLAGALAVARGKRAGESHRGPALTPG